MTVGAQDKKKVAILGVLFAVLGYYFYDAVIASPSVPASTARPTPSVSSGTDSPATRPMESPGPRTMTRRAQVQSPSRASRDEFVPVFREKRQGQDAAAAKPTFETTDPTVHWELLKKVQEVSAAGGTRNLFEVSAAPPKPVVLAKNEPIVKPYVFQGPKQPPPPPPPPPPAPPPPIPFKLYGVVTMRNTGKRTACFIDGDDILVASEGDILKRRYKIVSIGAKLVTVEDMDAKRQQSLTLPEDGNS